MGDGRLDQLGGHLAHLVEVLGYVDREWHLGCLLRCGVRLVVGSGTGEKAESWDERRCTGSAFIDQALQPIDSILPGLRRQCLDGDQVVLTGLPRSGQLRGQHLRYHHLGCPEAADDGVHLLT